MRSRGFPMNEKGSILLVILLVLLMASLIGVSSVTISTQETRIAANEKTSTMVFFEADGGIAPGVRVLLDTYANKSVGTYPAFTRRQITTSAGPVWVGWDSDTWVSGENTFLDEVMGATTGGKGFSFKVPPEDPGGIITRIRVTRNMATTRSTGSSTEFGSGYEGVGYGSASGVHIHYYITSTAGDTATNSTDRILTEYRKVSRMGSAQ